MTTNITSSAFHGRMMNAEDLAAGLVGAGIAGAVDQKIQNHKAEMIKEASDQEASKQKARALHQAQQQENRGIARDQRSPYKAKRNTGPSRQERADFLSDKEDDVFHPDSHETPKAEDHSTDLDLDALYDQHRDPASDLRREFGEIYNRQAEAKTGFIDRYFDNLEDPLRTLDKLAQGFIDHTSNAFGRKTAQFSLDVGEILGQGTDQILRHPINTTKGILEGLGKGAVALAKGTEQAFMTIGDITADFETGHIKEARQKIQGIENTAISRLKTAHQALLYMDEKQSIRAVAEATIGAELVVNTPAAVGGVFRTGRSAAKIARSFWRRGASVGREVGGSLVLSEVSRAENLSNLTAAERDFYSKAQLVGNYDYVHPGSLPNDMSITFSGSRYQSYKLVDDIILQRAGSKLKPFGQSFSFDAPVSELQTRIDKAILPKWPTGAKSPIDTGFAIKIPKGSIVHVGDVANQGGIFMGGTRQVVVQAPWKIPGIEVVGSYSLQEEALWNEIANQFGR